MKQKYLLNYIRTVKETKEELKDIKELSIKKLLLIS